MPLAVTNDRCKAIRGLCMWVCVCVFLCVRVGRGRGGLWGSTFVLFLHQCVCVCVCVCVWYSLYGGVLV